MTSEEPRLRVLVADDDERFRQRLAAVLEAVPGIELVGVARDGFEAVRLFTDLAPDVVLMDVVMPRCDGVEATKQILAIEPPARVIALTGAEDYRMLALCLAAGAKGCLRKGPDTIPLVPLLLALATPAKSPPSTPGGSSAEGSHPCTATPTPDARL
jgi:DNA-binding NarL/FixJ family response regulator